MIVVITLMLRLVVFELVHGLEQKLLAVPLVLTFVEALKRVLKLNRILAVYQSQGKWSDQYFEFALPPENIVLI